MVQSARRARWMLFIATASCAVACLVVDCGKPTADRPSGQHAITFWHFWSEPRQETALASVIVAFEKSHPGITVKTTALSWNEGKTKLLAAFNSGEVPDVVELGSDWVAQFSSSGVLADLSVDLADDTSRFLPTMLAPALWNRNIFASPWVVDTRVMFYNKELMARAGLDSSTPPTTWDALQADCEKITGLGGGIFGFGANASDAHRLYKKILPFFWANGGTVLSPDGKSCVINSEQNKVALNAYLRLASVGMFETQKQLDAQFAQGAIGFWFSGGWLVDKIHNEHPELHYGMSLMPQPSAGMGTRASFAGGEYLAVTGASKERAAALEFIRFLTGGENALAFCTQVTEAGYPADKKYLNDPLFTRDPHRAVFIAQLAASQLTPVHPQWLDMEKVIEDEVVEAMYGRKSADQALDDASAAINDILSRK